MSSAARNKVEKEAQSGELLKLLGRGQTKEAVEYLHPRVEPKSEKGFQACCTYLEKQESEILASERRQKAGKSIGSGRMEKGVDQVIGARQKSNGMSRRPTGSKALGILKVVELNGQWDQLWVPEKAAA